MAKQRAEPRRKPEPKLTRVAFRVSRLMEFCSIKELQTQTAHSVDEWPRVVAKEALDNALDACEEAEVAPEITVTVDEGVVVIEGNAGGIAGDTIESILDYTVRVSSREAYVSPAARKAMRSKPFLPWATSSIANVSVELTRRA